MNRIDEIEKLLGQLDGCGGWCCPDEERLAKGCHFLLSEVKRLERYESFVNRNGDVLADFENQEAPNVEQVGLGPVDANGELPETTWWNGQ